MYLTAFHSIVVKACVCSSNFQFKSNETVSRADTIDLDASGTSRHDVE